jgi:DNA-binding FrmR family transcriptional regulator
LQHQLALAQQMVADDVPCPLILRQLSAARHELRQISAAYRRACLNEALGSLAQAAPHEQCEAAITRVCQLIHNDSAIPLSGKGSLDDRIAPIN